MKKIGFFFYSFLSFLFSLTLATNLFAYLLHYPHVLGRPHFGKWYEPFHLIYWYLTVRAPGSQYRIAFIAFLLSFSALAFLGFRIYTRLKLNVLGIYGSARWFKTRELKKIGAFAGRGVILGQSQEARYRLITRKDNQQYRMTRPGKILFDNEKTHVLVVAPTRGGKGVSSICPTLLCWTHSAVVYDIKGENFEITSGWRRTFSHVFRFDPTSRDSIHFNPIWEIERGPGAVAQAQNIAQIISNPDGDPQIDDHWRISARQLLVGAILYVLYSNDEHDKSLHGVYRLLSNPNMPFESVLDQMGELDNEPVRESARIMLSKAENERSGVHSTAVSYLALYQDPIVAANTGYSDFCIKDLTTLEHPCTLYITINPRDTDRLRPLTRLLIDLISRKLTSNLHVNKHRLLFLIDEFPSLGRLKNFEKQLSYFAGYNIKCMLIAQSFNQIFAEYGERNSILDNCKRKAILGVGSPHDAKLVSDFLGSYSINRKTVSQSGTLGTIIARSRSTSYMETERKLMAVDDVLRLPYEDFILITDGQLPYRGRKLMYYLDSRFAPRVKRPTLLNFTDQLKEFPKRHLELTWITDESLAKLKRHFAELCASGAAQLPAHEAPKQIEATASVAGFMSDQDQSPPQPPSGGDTPNKEAKPEHDNKIGRSFRITPHQDF